MQKELRARPLLLLALLRRVRDDLVDEPEEDGDFRLALSPIPLRALHTDDPSFESLAQANEGRHGLTLATPLQQADTPRNNR